MSTTVSSGTDTPRRDRMLGTALMVAGAITWLAAIIPPHFAGEIGAPWLGHIEFSGGLPWMFGGFFLRNSHAENIGEGPGYRSPKARRIVALLFFVLGLVGLALDISGAVR